MPLGTTVDQRRTVAHDSSHTDPIVVHVDNVSLGSAEAGPKATQSSVCERLLAEEEEEKIQIQIQIQIYLLDM